MTKRSAFAALLAVAIACAVPAPVRAAGYHLAVDPCALAHDKAVAHAVGVAPAALRVVREARALEDGWVLCDASDGRPDGTMVTIGIAQTRSIREAIAYRSAACTDLVCTRRYERIANTDATRDFTCDRLALARRIAMGTDDGTPVPALGDRAFSSLTTGLVILRGDTQLRVATYRGGRERREQIEAEGFALSDPVASLAVARALLARLGVKRHAAPPPPRDCRKDEQLLD